MTPATFLRKAAEWLKPIATGFAMGTTERAGADAALLLLNLVADQLDAGSSAKEIAERLHGAPPLRSAIAEDRAAEDAAIAQKPSRDDEPTGR